MQLCPNYDHFCSPINGKSVPCGARVLSGSLDGANLADKFNAFGGYLPDVGGGVCVLHLAQGFDVALVFCPAALW